MEAIVDAEPPPTVAPRAVRAGLRSLVAPAVILLLASLVTARGWGRGRVFVNPEELPTPVPWTSAEPRPSPVDRGGGIGPMEYAAHRLKSAEIPLWNPSSGAGEPGVGSGRVGVFYPTILLHLVLPPRWAWTLSAIVKLFVAGAGTWVLARKQGIGRAGAVLAGGAFMLASFHTAAIHAPSVNATVLLPWGLLALGRLIDRATPWRVLLFASVLALQGTGASIAALIACVVVYVLAMLAFALVRPTALPRVLPAVAIAVLVGLSLGGAQLAPQLEWIAFRHGADPVISPLRELIRMVSAPARTPAVFGVVPLFLAVTGIVLRPRDGRVRVWVGVGFLSLVAEWVVQLLLRRVAAAPGMAAAASGPASLAGLGLAVALLAGIGLDAVAGLLTSNDARSRWFRTSGVMALVAALGGAVLLMTHGRPGHLLAGAAALALVAGVVFVATRVDRVSRWVPAAIVAIAIAELLPFAVVGCEAVSADAFATAVGGVSTWDRPRAAAASPDLRSNIAAARLLDVRYLVAPTSEPVPAPWKPIASDGRLTTYADPAPRPHAWPVKSVVHVPDASAEQSDLDARVPVDRIDNPFGLDVPPKFWDHAGSDSGVVDYASETPERATATVHGAVGGWLVVAEPFVPGWIAVANRQGVPIVRAAGLARAVPMTGASAVSFRYEPRGWTYGIFLTSGGAIACLLLLGWGLFPTLNPEPRTLIPLFESYHERADLVER